MQFEEKRGPNEQLEEKRQDQASGSVAADPRINTAAGREVEELSTLNAPWMSHLLCDQLLDETFRVAERIVLRPGVGT